MPIAPIELVKGRDLLNAIRSIVFELTGSTATTADLTQWIEHLHAFDPGYSRRARRALETEDAVRAGSSRRELPISYRNRRIAILDARACPDVAYSLHYLLLDLETGLEVGPAEWTRSGVYYGYVAYGPHELRCGGRTLGELASNGLAQFKWVMTH